jgi:hypothetical protein
VNEQRVWGYRSATFVGGEWMKTKESEVMNVLNSESRDRTRSSVENGAAGEGQTYQRIDNQVLRAVSLLTLLLDVRLNIPVHRGRGCASRLRRRICNITLIDER